jgi:O-antigen ligase
MASRAREAAGPLYLFLCLVLGGSAQSIWGNMALQLLGLGMLGWAASAPSAQAIAPPARHLLVLAMLGIGIVAVQAVPLPPGLWTRLGGRQEVTAGYRILGAGIPWLPISLTPYLSLDTLLRLIPPLALFCAIVRLKAYRPSWLTAALITGAMAGVILGALQLAQGGGDFSASSWYFYRESSFGFATGFFANANHMANLLVCTLPFLAALLVLARGPDRQRGSVVIIVVGAAALLIIAGIILNHSLAAYLLTLPVLGVSALMLVPKTSALRGWTLLAAALLLLAGVGATWTDAFRNSPLGSDSASAVESRQEMLVTTGRALRDFMPAGSGLGSFRSVYQLYEDPAQVTNTYVVHAHNDYAELALELGLPGILVIVGFLIWWARAAWSAWRHAESGLYPRAASIASAAILVHSLVDFPLRTAAIGAVFAMCLALLVERGSAVTRTKSDLWRTRHVVFQ